MRATASFAVAVLSMATIQLAHAADSIVQARAQLTELSFQLLDLTPNDGVGANYAGSTNSWSNQVGASYGVQGLSPSGTHVVTNELEFVRVSSFKGSGLDATLFSGEASATTDLSGASIQEAGVNLGKERFEEGFTYGELNGVRYGGPILNANASTRNGARLLGAGAGVTFAATFVVGVSVDASGLVGLTQGEDLRVQGAVDFSMDFLSAYSGSIPGLEFDNAQIHQSFSLFQDVGADGVISGNTDGFVRKTITVTGSVRNFSKQDVWLTEHWEVNALASVTPVPEPSTWAMLVAGLGLVPLMRRRQAA